MSFLLLAFDKIKTYGWIGLCAVGYIFYQLWVHAKSKNEELNTKLEIQAKQAQAEEIIKKDSHRVEEVANSPIKPNIKADNSEIPQEFKI
jgi:hypothetical protein